MEKLRLIIVEVSGTRHSCIMDCAESTDGENEKLSISIVALLELSLSPIQCTDEEGEGKRRNLTFQYYPLSHYEQAIKFGAEIKCMP